jgi:hypothetical protein
MDRPPLELVLKSPSMPLQGGFDPVENGERIVAKAVLVDVQALGVDEHQERIPQIDAQFVGLHASRKQTGNLQGQLPTMAAVQASLDDQTSKFGDRVSHRPSLPPPSQRSTPPVPARELMPSELARSCQVNLRATRRAHGDID